jgi:hypothetical protein
VSNHTSRLPRCEKQASAQDVEQAGALRRVEAGYSNLRVAMLCFDEAAVTASPASSVKSRCSYRGRARAVETCSSLWDYTRLVQRREDEDRNLGRAGSLERDKPIFLLTDTLRHRHLVASAPRS